MEWKLLIPLVEKAAPILASVLGGPAGMAVAAVGTLLTAGFGGTTPEEVAQNITNDPNAADKLAQIEASNSIQLQQLKLQQQQEADQAAQQQSQQMEQNLQDARQFLNSFSLKKVMLEIFGFTLAFYLALEALDAIFEMELNGQQKAVLVSVTGTLKMITLAIMQLFVG